MRAIQENCLGLDCPTHQVAECFLRRPILQGIVPSMQLSKSLLNEGHPEEIRVLAPSEERYRLAILLGQAWQAVINQHIVGQLVLVKSENVEAVSSILEEPLIDAGHLVKDFLLGGNHR